MGDMEDGPGPGERGVQGAGDVRTSGWERGKAEDLALQRGSGRGRARAAGREGPPEEHSRVVQGAHEQVWVAVPVHVQAARQGVAKALHAHGLALQHLRDQTVGAPAIIPTLCAGPHSLTPTPPLTWEGLGTTPRLLPW